MMKRFLGGHFRRLPNSSCLWRRLRHNRRLAKVSNCQVYCLALQSDSKWLLYIICRCITISRRLLNATTRNTKVHTCRFVYSLHLSLSHPSIWFCLWAHCQAHSAAQVFIKVAWWQAESNQWLFPQHQETKGTTLGQREASTGGLRMSSKPQF